MRVSQEIVSINVINANKAKNELHFFSKAVVKFDVVDKLIKNDSVDPINGEPMTEDDVIELQRGGTGYAATNEVKAKLIRPQLELQ